jgi:hypothetical protein
MAPFSRRVAVSILLGSCGCGRILAPAEKVINGPLPGNTELFASGNLQALRFHRRSETDGVHRVVDLWSDTNFIVNCTAAVRYEYRREGDSARTLRLGAVCCDLRYPINSNRSETAHAFLAAFIGRARELTRRLEESFQNSISAAVGSHKAFQTDELVGEIEMAYHPARESSFVTIAFYEKHFYEQALQVPNAPPPERLTNS